MKRWSIHILILLVVLPLTLYSVQAFGIATPYFPNDTVMLEPGQVFEYTIKAQNNEDISFYIDLVYNSDDDVAFLNTTNFYIPAKSYDNAFTFIITIPNLSATGTIYSLSYAAKPIINNSGQVPMNVEIKRSAKFIVVDENGQGYFPNQPSKKDRLIRNLANIFYASYTYIVGLVVLLAVIFVGMRLWHISKKMSAKTESKAPYAISEAKSSQEMYTLVKLMPNHMFNNEFIRKKYSERFKELNEPFLSKKVLTANRGEMLRILR